MKTVLFMVALALSFPALAQSGHSDKEAKEDAKRHRVLAQLHEAAAKCIESGKSAKDCHEQLRKDCKGVGIGKYCGMRHQH
jgi:hypothetical protein